MKLAQKSDAEILAIASPIMDNLMDASTAIDHDRHVANFTDRLKAIVTKEHLEKVCRQYQSEKGFLVTEKLLPFSGVPTRSPSSGNSDSRSKQGNTWQKWCSLKMAHAIWSTM